MDWAWTALHRTASPLSSKVLRRRYGHDRIAPLQHALRSRTTTQYPTTMACEAWQCSNTMALHGNDWSHPVMARQSAETTTAVHCTCIRRRVALGFRSSALQLSAPHLQPICSSADGTATTLCLVPSRLASIKSTTRTRAASAIHCFVLSSQQKSSSPRILDSQNTHASVDGC